MIPSAITNPPSSNPNLRSPPCANCRRAGETCELRDSTSTRCTRCARRHEKCHDTETSGKGTRSPKKTKSAPQVEEDEDEEDEELDAGKAKGTKKGSGRRREERLEQEVLLLRSEMADLRTRVGGMETVARENERRMLSILENMAMGRYPVFANVAGPSGTRREESESSEDSDEEENGE